MVAAGIGFKHAGIDRKAFTLDQTRTLPGLNYGHSVTACIDGDGRVKSEPDALRERIARKLARLLEEDEAGWSGAARWLEKRAFEEGFDLNANYDDALSWSRSVLEALRYKGRLPSEFWESTCLEEVEYAEELFWALMPRIERD